MASTTKQGRPRKPKVLKKLQGTYRPSREVTKHKAATGPKPRKPTGLSKQASSVWDQLCPKLYALGLVTEVDVLTFASYCQAAGDWVQTTRHLNKLGCENWYFETASGYRQQIPEVGVRDKVFQQMVKLGPRFGLDPVSREGLVSDDAPVPDFAEEFLFEPGVVA